MLVQTILNLAQHTPCGLLKRRKETYVKTKNKKKKEKKKSTCRFESIVPFETELRQIVKSNRTPK